MQRLTMQARPIEALIFDMDGTMINSMPTHAQSWVDFAQRHGLAIDLDDLMRRTTGRNGLECMRELFQCDLPEAEAWGLITEKETLYRALYAPIFSEVAGFKVFSEQALQAGLKFGVGSAGDQHNLGFAFSHLKLKTAPLAVVGGDEGLPGKPDPAIFLEAAKRMNANAASCLVFEDAPFGIEAARRAGMLAVAICTTHTPAQLAGPHVVASVRDYTELLNSKFLEKLHVATS